MLVPVQYQRLMARAEFDRFDLSSFRYKLSTSAPFAAALKADVLARWPGGLVEFYGMTEGASSAFCTRINIPTSCTVGQPAPGSRCSSTKKATACRRAALANCRAVADDDVGISEPAGKNAGSKLVRRRRRPVAADGRYRPGR
jgi:acyl-CoA synthetase (AMP-forming)/AMP-acid ligase II